MEVGRIEEEVTVIGISPIVDLTSSRLSTNVSREFFDSLPKGRSYQDMVQLAPSVQSDPWGAAMSGATGAENMYIIDGVNTTDVEDGLAGTNLTYEFIEEVQVKTRGYEPEFAGALGGVVNIITKSGSNRAAWRPVVQLSVGRPLRQAEGRRLWWRPIDGINYYDFGLSFSGPLIKDKLWFFFGDTPNFRKTFYRRTNPGPGTPDPSMSPTTPTISPESSPMSPPRAKKITLSAFRRSVEGDAQQSRNAAGLRHLGIVRPVQKIGRGHV